MQGAPFHAYRRLHADGACGSTGAGASRVPAGAAGCWHGARTVVRSTHAGGGRGRQLAPRPSAPPSLRPLRRVRSDSALLAPSSPSAPPPSMRRRRHAVGRLDPATVSALRDLLAPPADDGERAVEGIMARILAAGSDRPADARR